MITLKPPLSHEALVSSLLAKPQQQEQFQDRDGDEFAARQITPLAVFQALQQQGATDRRCRSISRRRKPEQYPPLSPQPTNCDSTIRMTSSSSSPSSVSSLTLSDEQLDLAAIGALQSMLSTNTSMLELEFVNVATTTRIGWFEKALVRGLAVNTQLQRLTVWNCRGTNHDNTNDDDDGTAMIQQISSYLKNDKNRLQYLCLYNSNWLLPVSVWQNLAAAMQDNFVLLHCTVGTYNLAKADSIIITTTDDDDDDDSKEDTTKDVCRRRVSQQLSIHDELAWLWAEPEWLTALDQIRYCLQRNRLWWDWQQQLSRHRRRRHQQYHDPVCCGDLSIQDVVRLLRQEQQGGGGVSTEATSAEEPQKDGCSRLVTVVDHQEHWPLSVLYDWVRQHPDAILY
jgi:hypothetical protein